MSDSVGSNPTSTTTPPLAALDPTFVPWVGRFDTGWGLHQDLARWQAESECPGDPLTQRCHHTVMPASSTRSQPVGGTRLIRGVAQVRLLAGVPHAPFV
jgi:hypothetical protein